MLKFFAAFAAQISLPFLLLIALAAPSMPQDPAPNKERPRKVFPKEQEPDDVVRIDTDLVSVDITALDAEGRPVRNLRQEDFKIFSDGVERPIQCLQQSARHPPDSRLVCRFRLPGEHRGDLSLAGERHVEGFRGPFAPQGQDQFAVLAPAHPPHGIRQVH